MRCLWLRPNGSASLGSPFLIGRPSPSSAPSTSAPSSWSLSEPGFMVREDSQGLRLFSILPLLVSQVAEALLPPPHSLRAGGHRVRLRLAVYRPLPSLRLRAGRGQPGEPLPDLDLGALVSREVIAVACQFVGKVLLRDVVSLELVWVLVAATAGSSRPQMSGYGQRSVGQNVRHGREVCPADGVALGGDGEHDGRLGQGVLS